MTPAGRRYEDSSFTARPHCSCLLIAVLLWQEPAPVTKRDYCINELVETEKNYIEALAMIINVCQSLLLNKIIFWKI